MSILGILPIDGEKLLKDALLVGDGKPYSKFSEGVKVGQAGVKYDIIAPALEYRRLSVKREGEIVPTIKYPGYPVPIKFTGISVKLYRDFQNNGEIKLSISAESAHLVEKARLKVNMEG